MHVPRILIALLSLSLGAGLAAEHGSGGHGPMGGGPGMEEGHSQDPAKLKELLGLSDAQVAKLKALKDDRQDLKSLRRESRDKMQKLGDLVEDQATEAEISAALKELDALQAKLRDAMEKLKAERHAILTPLQRAKLITMKHGKGKGGQEQGRPMKDERP